MELESSFGMLERDCCFGSLAVRAGRLSSLFSSSLRPGYGPVSMVALRCDALEISDSLLLWLLFGSTLLALGC